MYMPKKNRCAYGGMSITLTIEGRLALAADAVAAARMARSEKRLKRICEEAVNHLRSIIQSSRR